jgi:hypothetical protein
MFNFKKEKEPEDLKQVLKQFIDLKKDFKEVIGRIDSAEKKVKSSIQKIGIVRYNPFSNVGGDQSFSIALLNGENSGIVITSLYSRDGNRVYSKPIEKGVSEYTLSNEEVKAINEAKNK